MMTFGFLIVCRATPETEIVEVVGELFTEARKNIGGDFEDEALSCQMSCRHLRFGDESTDNDGQTTRQMLADFALHLQETEVARNLIEEFIARLDDSPIIHHVVKFEDPLLQKELVRRAAEIFEIEMKLRRVLSSIYLHAYKGKDPFDLLREEEVQPMGRPTEEQMKSATENQFFHLSFSQYRNLNQRQQLKLKDILDVFRNAEQYDAFRAEIFRSPIEHENDTSLLADIKELMNPIEGMRNCVAHNRYPSSRLTQNYHKAFPQLHEILDNYLSRWDLLDGEMPWDNAAREAVEGVLENALWDQKAKTITLNDYGARDTVSSRDELQEFLEQVASQAFYANVPYEDGAPVFECDEYGVVESMLSDHDERLTEFFDENGTDGLS